MNAYMACDGFTTPIGTRVGRRRLQRMKLTHSTRNKPQIKQDRRPSVATRPLPVGQDSSHRTCPAVAVVSISGTHFILHINIWL